MNYAAVLTDLKARRLALDALISKLEAAMRAGALKLHRRPEAVHGTVAMYANYRCRCEECRKANKVYHAEYRLRRWHSDATGANGGAPKA